MAEERRRRNDGVAVHVDRVAFAGGDGGGGGGGGDAGRRTVGRRFGDVGRSGAGRGTDAAADAADATDADAADADAAARVASCVSQVGWRRCGHDHAVDWNRFACRRQEKAISERKIIQIQKITRKREIRKRN